MPLVTSFILACALALDAQTPGPRPETRELLDALRSALNSGNAATWEAFAQERFTADLIKRRTPAERGEMHERVHADLGTISFDQVRRRGPAAPLEISVSGSTGETAALVLEIVDGTPLKISSLTLDIGRREVAPGDGPAPPPISAKMSNEQLHAALDQYFAKLAAGDVFSGVALVARRSAPVFHEAYGLADRANRVANTVRTRFNIGSINKTFTKVAIAQLAGEGKVAFTDTVGKFFPEYPQEVTRAATIQQLLDHRAGVADFFGPEFSSAAKDRFRSNADYFAFVSNQPALFAPGARNQYCNGCYITLGAIVARVSGMTYERYVAEHIFQRDGMSDTGYPHSDSVEPNIALGYTRSNGALRSNVLMHGAAGSAAGGGYSTAMDLLAYVKAVQAGRFPGVDKEMGIAGGAPGINATVETSGEWVVIVLTNFDPPTGERLGVAIADALRR
jgi:CubicO group peptidase (beta-lactamase class C family)